MLVATAVCAFAPSAFAAPIEIGSIPKCTEAVPAAVSLTKAPTAPLRVRVLLDGVSLARGQQVMQRAATSYAPLGLTLTSTFQSVTFGGTDAEGLIQQAKALHGGRRPVGSDLVYTITSKDIQVDGETAVAGLADCIGGVAFADRAFAVGETLNPDDFDLVVPVAHELTAKVGAHEIGHLMGGHHQYANCAEGLLSETGQELSPCTLMINAVDLASFNFSAVNGLVVRGHAEAYTP